VGVDGRVSRQRDRGRDRLFQRREFGEGGRDLGVLVDGPSDRANT